MKTRIFPLPGRIRLLLSQLGPGLLYAGAAVGVSHLVQSTKAGGMFGFYLIAAIVVVHLFKYPFYEFGPRYTAATGKNILHGYRKLGNWALWVFLLMTIATMFIIQAAVTVVTAGLTGHIFHLQQIADLSPQKVAAVISFGLLILSFSLLATGRYQLLDSFIKVIIVILSITSVMAVVILSFDNPGHYRQATEHFSFKDTAHLVFLATFLGWMPAPLDISIWHSIWSESRNESTGQAMDLKAALFDFRVGYIGTALLAICFLLLGALVMYGSGREFSPNGAVFAGQLLDMYRQSLGDWAYPIIAAAALTTMFSTVVTCLDAFPRTLNASLGLLFPDRVRRDNETMHYLLWLLVTIAGTLCILFFFLTSMKQMVSIATVIAFVAAPVLAGMNMLAMFDKDIDAACRPGKLMLIWCLLGLTALSACSIGYLIL
ncbi:MAG: NRAMP family divalent metal transporter [Gammaproteobacteria bacterium]